ncbi:UvrD/REP helicase [Methanofollis liminatans DSM 4140]|uniref:DNA 3'-5' helicase n=1 Tax=Methanofollis liminatans DSM 4140 TaxID=28892 RepID=J0RYM5_9EURY|nr:ATP-dependent helicase [Methanofollis liminatans]EJG06656.1 UvrD/REP helicase [Methanofollis liminatans DSM 4140]
MTADLIRWRGGPGAGKSTTLIEFCRAEVSAGAAIGDISVMTFSRAQASDLARRLHELVFLDADPKTISRMCGTIHACALRQCMAAGLIEDPREQVITVTSRRKAPIYEEFMAGHGLAFDPTIGAEDDAPSRADLPVGNQVIALAAYLTATMRQPDEWRVAATALGLAAQPQIWPFSYYITAWRDYKAKNGLFEHEDYIRLALVHRLPPPASILVVDEYQDVSPAQDALIRSWIEHPETKRVYVAGDPDQSIYGFRGCNPRLFLAINAEDRGATGPSSRPVSHRCPVSVMAAAESILNRPANVSPCIRRGQVHHVQPPDADALARQVEEAIRYARTLPGERQPVFVLSRYQKTGQALARALSAAGVPCSSIKPGRVRFWSRVRIGRDRAHLETTTVSPWTLKQAITRYLAGSSAIDPAPVPTIEAETMILATLTDAKRTDALAALRRLKSKREPVRLGDVYAWTGGHLRDGIFDALNLRPWIVREIRACLTLEQRRGYEIPPDMVKIDTIHAAKGLEAAVVLLHTGFQKKRLDDLTDPDRLAEERRVFYVGATRASHALLLLDYGETPVCPFLRGVGA